MGIIQYTVSQINTLLGKAETSVQPTALTSEAEARSQGDSVLAGAIGTLSGLSTEAKDNLVAAINELFTSASEGKSAIAAAITGRGIAAAASETFAALAAKISQLQPPGYVDPDGYVQKRIANADSITPTGTYATSTYYNTDFGVKIGYMDDGAVMLAMKAGATTKYEYLQFTLASAPSGVTITTVNMGSDSGAGGKAAVIYACILSGVPVGSAISIAMNTRDDTYDYTTCAITVS